MGLRGRTSTFLIRIIDDDNDNLSSYATKGGSIIDADLTNNNPITHRVSTGKTYIHFGIPNQKLASRAENWIKVVTSKACLKELCLTILPDIASFTFSDDIFASAKLNKLSLKLDESKNNSLHICSNPVINCVNLRVLELLDVHISEDVFHNLLSTCKLLEKINLELPQGLKKIKVNNLHYLHELKITRHDYLGYLEISNVPCLRSLSYNAKLIIWRPVLSNTDSIGSLRELCLNYVSMDDECSDMINSKFPFLESLTLHLIGCDMETLDIRCVSLRRLKIHLMQKTQIKMRDALNLSSKFKIELKCYGFMVPFDIDDVRRRITFPATNVEYLLFEAYDKSLCKMSLITDVLFCVCHPNYIEVNRPLTHRVASFLLKLNKRETMEMKTGEAYWPHLKSGEIRNRDGKLETLASSSISLLEESGRVSYARILVEVIAGKGFLDMIEVVYANKHVLGYFYSKFINDWPLYMSGEQVGN
ncbi:hypothetical protein Tco_0328159 [Tanacetum coccineum]